MSVFEENMRHPFNAREVSKSESRRLYRSDFQLGKYKGLTSRTFVSKTTFDGDVPAVFYGYAFDTGENPAGKNSFGLILQVSQP